MALLSPDLTVLQRVFDRMPLGYLRVDGQGRIDLANPAAAAILGTQVEVLLTTQFWCEVCADSGAWERLKEDFSDRDLIPRRRMRFLRNDGGTVLVECQLQRVPEAGDHREAVELMFREVGEEHGHEGPLRDHEASFRDLFDTAPLAYFSTTMEGIVLTANPQASELLGYPHQALIGRSVLELYPETEHGRTKAARLQARAQEGQEILDEELEMQRADGSRVWVNLTVRFVRDARGEIVGRRGIVREITQQKRQATLLQAIHQAETDFIASEDPVGVFDRLLSALLALTESAYGFIGEVQYRNDGQPFLKTHAITNIAWTRETRELYERKAPNLEFFNLRNLFGHVIMTEQPVIANDPARDPRAGGLPDGHPPLNAFLGLPFFRRGRLVGMVGLANRPGGYDETLVAFLQPFLTSCATMIEAHQIEQRRQETEGALRESEARWQAFFDHSSGMVFLKDLAGRYLYVNRAFLEHFQLSEGSVVGRTDEEVFEPERAERLRRYDRLALERRQPLEFEEGIEGEGPPRIVLINLFPVLSDQQRIYALGGIGTDITQRKHTESLLQKWATIFHHTQWGVAVGEADGDRLDLVNQAYANLHGYTEQELVGQPISLVFAPEERAKLPEYIETIHRTGHHSFESTHIRKDGSRFPALVSVSAIRDDQGTSLYRVANVIDISRRKEIERELRNSREAYEQLLNSIDGIVWECEFPAYTFTYVSRQAERLLGYPVRRWFDDPKFFRQVLHEEDRDWALGYCERETRGLRDHELEYRLVHQDGKVLWFHDLVRVIVQDGRPVKLRGLMIDVTDRKRAEAELKESQARFRSVFEHAGIGIVLLDGEDRFLEANPAFHGFLGYGAEELGVMRFTDCYAPDHALGDGRLDEELLSAKRLAYQTESPFLSKDRRNVWGRVTKSAVRDSQGRLRYVIGMIEDITERKRMEELVQRQKWELEQEVRRRAIRIQELEQRKMHMEKLAALAQVAAGVAHEINNPLASISQALLLFKRSVTPDHSRFTYIQKMEDCVERIAHVVKQLYLLYRPESGTCRPVDLRTAVNHAVDIMKERAIQRGLNIVSHGPSHALMARISRPDLIQVLCNLLQNAIDVSSPGGVVSIFVDALPDRYTIAVQDSGPGIPANVAPHVFEPFFTTKQGQQEGGMGLGLAVSYGLVESMQGALDFTTAVGKGTTFRVTIPATNQRRGP